jgi:hypothetical protein
MLEIAGCLPEVEALCFEVSLMARCVLLST